MATTPRSQRRDASHPSLSPTNSLKRKIDSITPDYFDRDGYSRTEFPIAQATVAPLRIRRYNSSSGSSTHKIRNQPFNQPHKPRKSASISDFGQLGFLSADPHISRGKSIVSNTSTTISESKTDSTTPSISKFPRPPSIATPKLSAGKEGGGFSQLPSTVYSPPLPDFRQHKRPIPQRGSTFDAFGSQTSIDSARIHAFRRLNQSSEDSSGSPMAGYSSPTTQANLARQDTPSIASNGSDKDTPPPRAIFEDLPTAHSSILRVTNSKWKISSGQDIRIVHSPQNRPYMRRSRTSSSSPNPNTFFLSADRPDSPLIHSNPDDLEPSSNIDEEALLSQEPTTTSWRDKLTNIIRRRSKSPLPQTPDLEAQTDIPMTPLSPTPRRRSDFHTAVSPAHSPRHPPNAQTNGLGLKDHSGFLGGEPSERELSPEAVAYFEERTINVPGDDSDENLFALQPEDEHQHNAGRRSTVGSFLKHYGDREHLSLPAVNPPIPAYEFHSYSEDERPKTSHSTVSRATSRFSQFDFGINQYNEEYKELAGRTIPSDKNLAPGAALQAPGQKSSSSHRSLYDDKSSADQSSFGALADLSEQELNSGIGKRSSDQGLRARPNLSRNASSRRLRGSGLSKNSSDAAKSGIYEQDLSDELRRISRQSGMSRVSGTILVFNDGQVTESPIKEESNVFDTDRLHDMIHGPGQITRYSATSDVSDDIDLKEPQGPDSQYFRRRSIPGRSRIESALTNTGKNGFDQEDEAEWETVRGSRAFSRSMFPSRVGIVRDTTRSSIADFSDDDDEEHNGTQSRYEHQRQNPLSPVVEILQHPADPRYKHTYRLGEVSPDREPILLPTYDFTGANAFPHRNALSPPSPSPAPVEKSYQHPAPLPETHANPFRHSPILDKGAVRSGPGSPSDAYGRDGTGVAYIHADSPSVYRFRATNSGDNLQRLLHPGGKSNRPESGAKNAINQSFQSSVWMDTFGDLGSDFGDEGDIPSRNGSFSKTTVLGPKMNITGTPDGTNMREVGSSLADRSSPGPAWTSSPKFNSSAQKDHTGTQYATVRSPDAAFVRDSPGLILPTTPEDPMHDHIREHRDQLAAEGLLPRTKHNYLQPRSAGHVRGESAGPFSHHSEDEAFAHPRLPPLPRIREPLILEQAHLQRHPRDDSSHGLLLWQRKKHISRIVLALCVLFPPMLLLYGYGFMDTVMISLSHGEISKFGRAEKRFALFLGWAIGLCAILGIIIGMIVVGLAGR